MRNQCGKNLKEYIKNFSKYIKNHSDYYKFGFECFGPFLYGYVNWLYQEIIESKCKKVFFFSRDGYMMKQAFDIYNNNNIISSKYVYFSRKSIRQALLHRFSNYQDSLMYLTWERYITIGKLLEYYGFSEVQCKRIAIENNLSLYEDLLFDDLTINKKMEKLFYKIKPYIDKNSIAQDAILERYLNQIDMNGLCAIVDIGWHGSMQYFLEEYCAIKNIRVQFRGFYVGVKPNKPIVGTCDGYLYNENDLKLRKDVLCFFGGYEKLFQSCEGSTYGYILQNDIVEPIFATYEYYNDIQFINCINEWQSGALKFVKIICCNDVPDIQIKDKKHWAYPLIEFGKNPSMKDVRLFNNFYNIDGTKTYYISQKPLYKYKPRELIHALSNSVWKTGFMKSLFKIPFPYFYVYCLLKK